jgi:hypothetical protein
MKRRGPPTTNGANTVPTPASNIPAPKLHVQFLLPPTPSRTPQASMPAAPVPEKPRTTSKLGQLIPFRRSSLKRTADAIPVATVPPGGRARAKPSEPPRAAPKTQLSMARPIMPNEPATPETSSPHALLEPTPPPTLPRQPLRASAGPSPSLPLPLENTHDSGTALHPEMTPPSTPNPPQLQAQTPALSFSQPSRVPRYVPDSAAGLAQRDQASEQRYKTSSPALFFSDDESDEDRSRIPVLRFPRNSGNVLQRGRVGRGNGVRDVR